MLKYKSENTTQLRILEDATPLVLLVIDYCIFDEIQLLFFKNRSCGVSAKMQSWFVFSELLGKSFQMKNKSLSLVGLEILFVFLMKQM